MKKKIMIMFMCAMITIMMFNSVFANDWWEQAQNFFSGVPDSAVNIESFLDPLMNMVEVVGNMVFVLVTVVLGVKYIWGGVESKASVKDSLITLVVAALVFYGWDTISNLIHPNTFIKADAQGTASVIYSTILYICNFLAVGGIVYIGIKYMMAGAEGRASLKAQSVPVVLGIVMVYATISFLSFIVGIL
jgi:hypothetical protein